MIENSEQKELWGLTCFNMNGPKGDNRSILTLRYHYHIVSTKNMLAIKEPSHKTGHR